MEVCLSLHTELLVPLIVAMGTVGAGLFVYYEVFAHRRGLARFRQSNVMGILPRRK
jgi:hypothetical protein